MPDQGRYDHVFVSLNLFISVHVILSQQSQTGVGEVTGADWLWQEAGRFIRSGSDLERLLAVAQHSAPADVSTGTCQVPWGRE